MLRIRSEQMRLLNRPLEVAFRKAVTEYLEADFPAVCARLGPAGVAEMVEDGIRRAGLRGFEFESDICEFIGLMAEFGTEFDRLDWAAAILNEAGTPPPVKAGQLSGWAEAIRGLQGGRSGA